MICRSLQVFAIHLKRVSRTGKTRDIYTWGVYVDPLRFSFLTSRGSARKVDDVVHGFSESG
jgi:hypothetical protein